MRGTSVQEASIRIEGEFWEGGHDQRLSLTVEGFFLKKSALNILRQRLKEWVELPLEAMTATPLRGQHKLAYDHRQAFDLFFGPRNDVIATRHQVISIDLCAGRLQAQYYFVTDQSCLRMFADDLSALLNADARKEA